MDRFGGTRPYFDDVGGEPTAWTRTGEQFSVCAEVLDAEIALQSSVWYSIAKEEGSRRLTPESRKLAMLSVSARVPAFLRALAAENFLKGLAIFRDETWFTEPEKWERLTHGHSLLQIADWARVSLNPQTTRGCEVATQLILWSGRYPVPKKRAAFNLPWLKERKLHGVPGMLYEEDDAALRSLLALAADSAARALRSADELKNPPATV